MKITPLDIQQVGFKIKLRGYDRQEVDAFLDSLTEDYEALIRENNHLREKLMDFENQTAEIKKKEATLNSMLMKAQDLSDEMKAAAQKDADLILREAELKTETYTRSAREHLAEVQRDILDLKKQKVVFIEKVRSMIRIFEQVLDTESGGEERESPNRAAGEAQKNHVPLLKPQP